MYHQIISEQLWFCAYFLWLSVLKRTFSTDFFLFLQRRDQSFSAPLTALPTSMCPLPSARAPGCSDHKNKKCNFSTLCGSDETWFWPYFQECIWFPTSPLLPACLCWDRDVGLDDNFLLDTTNNLCAPLHHERKKKVFTQTKCTTAIHLRFTAPPERSSSSLGSFSISHPPHI